MKTLSNCLFLMTIIFLMASCSPYDTIEGTEEYLSDTYWNYSQRGGYLYAFKLLNTRNAAGNHKACYLIETPMTGLMRFNGDWWVTGEGKATIRINGRGEFPSFTRELNLKKNSDSFKHSENEMKLMPEPAQNYILKCCPDLSI